MVRGECCSAVFVCGHRVMAVGTWDPLSQILPAAGESFGFGGAESDCRSDTRCGMEKGDVRRWASSF